MFKFLFNKVKSKKDLSDLEVDVEIKKPEKTTDQLFDDAVNEVFEKNLKNEFKKSIFEMVYAENLEDDKKAKDFLNNPENIKELEGLERNQIQSILIDKFPKTTYAKRISAYSSYSYYDFEDSVDIDDLTDFLCKKAIKEWRL